MQHGSLAQLGEHLPYKQRVIGSSPIVSTTFQGESLDSYGLVVQLVRTPPCHGGGRGFESHRSRHFFAVLAHLVERNLAKVEVAGSSPVYRSIKILIRKNEDFYFLSDFSVFLLYVASAPHVIALHCA